MTVVSNMLTLLAVKILVSRQTNLGLQLDSFDETFHQTQQIDRAASDTLRKA